jgi:hypothetical protein
VTPNFEKYTNKERVQQRYSLSKLLFKLVMNEIIEDIKDKKGCRMENKGINILRG